MIYETETIAHDGLRYKVQVRQRLDGSIQQRHIWFQTQAGEHDPPWVNPWIASCCRSMESAARGKKPSNDLDEMGEALAALEAIANGHNDPRQRAHQALAAIRSQRDESY